MHCAKDAEIIQPVVEEENEAELEFEIWRQPQLPKMATVAIVSEVSKLEKNQQNNKFAITPTSSESSWSMKLWKFAKFHSGLKMENPQQITNQKSVLSVYMIFSQKLF